MFERIESSYVAALGQPLAPVDGDLAARARWVDEESPFGLLAHGAGPEPLFTYANRTALRCFEMTRDQLVGSPSSASALPDGQADREELLARVARDGFATGYRGLRVASSGRTFWIEDVTMWNLDPSQGAAGGQAALFPRWTDADQPAPRGGYTPAPSRT